MSSKQNHWHRKLIAVGIGVVLSASTLVACSSSPSTAGNTSTAASSGDDAPSTLNVQALADGFDLIEAQIKIFKKTHPNVDVKLTGVTPPQRAGSNLQVLTANNAPDVGLVLPNSSGYSTMVETKQLVSLKDVWKTADLNNRYEAGLASALTPTGTPYVISMNTSYYSLVYYNKDLFKKLGIAEPKDHRFSSIAQMGTIAAKLRAADKQPMGVGAKDGYQVPWMVSAFLQTSATPEEVTDYINVLQPDGKKSGADYSDPAFVRAVNAIKQLADKDVFADGFLGQSVAQAESAFIQGSSGMMLDGTFSVAAFKKEGLNFDLGWALLPSLSAKRPAKLLKNTGNTMGVPANAANPKMAKAFLASIMSPAGQAVQPQYSFLPAVAKVPAKALTPLPSQVQDMVADATKNGSATGWGSVVGGNLGQLFINPLLQEMVNGSRTAQSVGDAMQKQVGVLRAASGG